ncbi:MAG TPA: tetratricopeptide repeat protein [Verrucomicrobiae bacterium]
MRRGERDIKAGNYLEAVERLKEAAQTLANAPHEQQSKAWNLLGMAYQGAVELDNASQAYAQALKLDHKNTAVDYNLGCLRLEQMNYQGAIDYLTTYVQLRPGDANGYLKLANARYHLALASAGAEKMRQLQNARVAYEDADKVKPTAEAANGLGMIELVRRGGGTETLRAAGGEFQTALQRDPDYPPALLNLAIIYQYLNDVKSAVKEYAKYVGLQPPPPHVKEVEKLAHELDLETRIFIGSEPKQRPAPTTKTTTSNAPSTRPRNAQNEPRPSQTINPTPEPVPPPQKVAEATPVQTPAPPPKTAQTTPAPAQTAETTQTNARPPPAETPAPATPVNSTTPTNDIASEEKVPGQPTPAPKKTLTQKLNPLHWFSGKPKTAATSTSGPNTRYDYPDTVTYIPGNREAAERLANEAAEERREAHLDAAVRDYRKAVAADPTYFNAALSLGMTAIDRMDYGTALDALGHALALEENSADARYAYAWAMEQRGFYIDAAHELEKLLTAHPQEVRAHLLLGNLYAEKLGQPRLAREQYTKVLDLDPNNLQAPALRAWILQGAR